MGEPSFRARAAVYGLVIAAVSCDSGPVTTGSCLLDEDCQLGMICSIGGCVSGCRPGGDRCPVGQTCIGGVCQTVSDAGLDASGDCPPDMVVVAQLFCMDRYEASRPNATGVWQGDDNSMATSRAGVLPWFPVDKATAQAACAAAGKRMCTPNEFSSACHGPGVTDYPYGNTYDPLACNSIDTFCDCASSGVCGAVEPCPYPHCFNSPPAGQATPLDGCGAISHVTPTGAFAGCVNEYGAYDLSGNVWETVDDGTAEGVLRGGAHNCIDSPKLHHCDYATTSGNARGFRCCR